MSYEKGKKEGYDIVCDKAGCKNKLHGSSKGEVWQAAKAAGWQGISAAEHYCPTHNTKKAKASNNGKSAKSAKSAKKGSMKGKPTQGGRVIEYGKRAEEAAEA